MRCRQLLSERSVSCSKWSADQDSSRDALICSNIVYGSATETALNHLDVVNDDIKHELKSYISYAMNLSCN